MTAKTLMIQGTGSHVGKSFLVAGLCRLFKNDGIAVAPYKSQNMALNSFATRDGLEMGRAQATQAQAAGIEPDVLMNPILLKPTSERRAQVIVLGKPVKNMDARAYHQRKKEMLSIARNSLEELCGEYELVVIEGAGSPVEINLVDRDIVNMAIAGLVDAPVVLVADIDKGGAFASIVGTLELLPPADRERVKGFIINKFRGDIELLEPGLRWLEERTGLPVLGVVPHIDVILEDEDSVSLDSGNRSNAGPALLRIAVPQLPRISNFTDFQPFELTEGVCVDFVRSPGELGLPDAVILPGTKNTLLDMAWLRKTGLADSITGLARSGVPIIGICGGFQMLGRMVNDPLGIEGDAGSRTSGLGLLPIETELTGEKTVRQIEATIRGGADILGAAAVGSVFSAYEIHAGISTPVGSGAFFAETAAGAEDGWVSPDLKIMGTYMHGLFDTESLRRSFLDALAAKKGFAGLDFDSEDFEVRIDRIAEVLRASLKMEELRQIVGAQMPEMDGAGVV